MPCSLTQPGEVEFEQREIYSESNTLDTSTASVMIHL